MGNFSEVASSQRGCEDLLIESCRIYREVENIYADIMGAISKSGPVPVETAAVLAADLLQEAGRLDAAIAESLISAGEPTTTSRALLQQREDILLRLHSINRSLANKAENIQTLIRHEIVGMANNRNALRGYKPADTERRSIISSSY